MSAAEVAAPGRKPYGVRLRAAVDEHGPLCVGVDPHPALLQSWGLDDDVAGLERFSRTCLEALGGHVATVKPQSAFFERYGSRGVAVLEDLLAGLREAGTLSLLDVKRGDIGSTMTAYAQAYLAEGAPLAADAVTLSPYLGLGSLRPALDLAAATGRGVFVLGLTSNPEGPEVQHAVSATGHSVAADVVDQVARENLAAGAQDLGHVGLVVGATVGDAVQRLRIDLSVGHAPLLAPGVGAQGATSDDLRRVFGASRRQVLASTSREVLSAGPDLTRLRDAAYRSRDAVASALAAATG